MFREWILRFKWWRLDRKYWRDAYKITFEEMPARMKEINRAQNLIELHRSRRLSHRAASLDIQAPPRSDTSMWVPAKFEDGYSSDWLTPKGRAYVRKLIGEEKQRRFDVRMMWFTKFWLPLLAALVGIIGALTGLVAVLHHR